MAYEPTGTMVFKWVAGESGKAGGKYSGIGGVAHFVVPAPALGAGTASPQEGEGIQAGVTIIPEQRSIVFASPVGSNGGGFHGHGEGITVRKSWAAQPARAVS